MAQELSNKSEVCKGLWSRDERRFADRLLYTVGKIVVGAVDHPTVSKGEARVSKATLYVPGISLKQDRYNSDDEAKGRVERAFATWFTWLQPID